MWMIYGAAGYMGRMIAAELSRRGVPFIAAGRDGEALRAVPGTAPVSTRVFPLDSPEQVAEALGGVTHLLLCAGPFERTAALVARACVARGVHYLDIAGEVNEHEAVRALDAEARARGVMLLPGVGFGCVPTELAAVEAVARLGRPARSLEIAYETVGGASRGTLETVLRGIHHAGVQRRDGVLVSTRPGAQATRLDLGGGEALVVTNPWRADLVAAFASTGVPEITTLATFPLPARLLMRSPRFTGSAPGQWLVDRIVRSAPVGPSDAELARGRTRIRATATAADATRASVVVQGPEAYVFTALLAAQVVQAVAAGAVHAGHSAPSHVLPFEALGRIQGVRVVA